MDGLGHHQLEAQKNWAVALETYRTALTTYRRLLGMRAERGPERTALAGHTPSAQPPQPVVHACRLEGLTPREREVADLVARGYSNQQIADALVLTRGTVANRTQVAAWVFDRTPPGTRDGTTAGGSVSAAPPPAPLYVHAIDHRVATPAD